MSRVDLHPDELLDPSRRRSLTPEERERLDRHLAQCPACAFEALASEDFARWLDHGAAADDPGAARATARTLAVLEARPVTPARPASSTGPSVRWTRRLLVAAALLALTAGAGAATWYLAIQPLLREPPRTAAPALCPADAGGVAAPGLVRVPEPLPPPGRTPHRTVPESPAPSPEPLAPPPEPIVPPSALRPVVPDVPHPSPVVERVGDAAAVSGPREPSPPTPSAAQLLAQANEARRDGNYDAAAELYRALQREHPGTREELVSRVTLGRVLLDRLGDPAGALALFDGYLFAAPDGTLAEEALVGRALSLQSLGRSGEEREAWTTLLARYPGSANAERARGRLNEIVGEAP